MSSTTFTFQDPEGGGHFVYRWSPDTVQPRAALQIAPGLAEHAGRYGPLAEYYARAGFVCYANDHRGHGRTAGDVSRRGLLGVGGWDGMVRDLKTLTDIIGREHPGKPLFLLGHSLGSLLAQDYAQRWGAGIQGMILSGSNGRQPFVVQYLGILLSRILVALRGPDAPSDLAYNLTFRAYNKTFLPSATGTDFDWLNRDKEKVRAYVEDPWCGFRVSNQAALELALGLKKIWDPANEKRIPVDLPVLVVSGTADSTSAFLENLEPLVRRYRERVGVRDVTTKYYPDARHEIFNETCREEALADVLAWMEARLGPRHAAA